MHLLELTCEKFRCLSALHFAPGPALNVIRGDNAQGKTSILEALLYAATSKSHRTSVDSELAQRGERAFRIGAHVQRTNRDVRIELSWAQGTKRITINGVSQTRVSESLGKVNVVMFSPEDAELVRGSASHRRTFLDMELSQLNVPYLHALQRYRHAMRQRNELLRAQQPDHAQLDVWDAQLAEHGALLIAERQHFIDQLAPLASDAYRAIAGEENFSVVYKPDVRDEGALADALAAARKTDLRQAVTSRGPHRDELDFAVEEKPARQFASQGQQKTAGLAVKLAELELMRARTGEYPILMLDDVFAELDASRSHRVLSSIPHEVQCLITSTEFAITDELRDRNARVFTVRAGALA